MKREGSGSASKSGYISQRHGSVDPDPDPHQNVMDPQHWSGGKELRGTKEPEGNSGGRKKNWKIQGPGGNGGGAARNPGHRR
jgi:hypothetical protein